MGGQSLFLLGCLWLGAISCKAQSRPVTVAAASAETHLCWQEGQRLMWGDFRSPRCYGEVCAYSSFVDAVTAADVPVIGFVDAQGLDDYRVSCVFVRDSSWANPRVVTPNDRAHALAHEQVHFDLAELTARKIRRCIAQHRAAGDDLFGPVVTTDIQCTLNELDALNALYDDDVNLRRPAVEAPAQRRWELRVARELRALARYRSTATTCPD